VRCVKADELAVEGLAWVATDVPASQAPVPREFAGTAGKSTAVETDETIERDRA
jgi:peptide/nickel transport system permease protein